MKLNELGAILKKARENKGISLDDLFETTKIQVKLLEALEEGNYDAFPGDVYVKGALRNYAEAVGLEYEEVSSLYRKAKGVEEALPQVPEKEPKPEPVLIKEKVRKVKKRRSAPKPLNLRPLFTTLAVLLILFLAAMGINYWLTNRGNNSLPPDNDPSVTDPDNGNDSDSEDPDTNEPVVEMSLLKTDPSQEDYTLTGAAAIQLEMSFKGDCWVRVDKGSEKIMSKTFRSGQTYKLDADQALTIRLGYPRGVSLMHVNGLDLAVLDRRDPYNITIRLEP